MVLKHAVHKDVKSAYYVCRYYDRVGVDTSHRYRMPDGDSRGWTNLAVLLCGSETNKRIYLHLAHAVNSSVTKVI